MSSLEEDTGRTCSSRESTSPSVEDRGPGGRETGSDLTVEIIYETHSTTADNENGLASGWLPGKLSENRRRQARALGERRRGREIAAVFVSDLTRATETAEIAFGGDIPIYSDARLRECNYGDFNGMPVERLNAERSSHIDDPWPGGQSYREVVAQMDDFLRDLATRWGGSTVVVIGHSANRWALDHLLKGLPSRIWLTRPLAGRRAGATNCLPDGPLALLSEEG